MSCSETWNLVVNIVIAIGTIGAVIVALFGENIKNALFKAKLSLELGDANGELTNWSYIYPHMLTPIGNKDYFFDSESIGTTCVSGPSGISGSLSLSDPSGYSGSSGIPRYFGATGSSGFLQESQNKIAGQEVIYYHLKVKNHKPRTTVSKCRVILKEIHSKDPDTKKYTKLTLTVPPRFQWAPAETSPPAVDFVDEQILDFGYLEKGADEFRPSLSPSFNNFKGNLKANGIIKYTLEVQANNAKTVRVELEVSWDGNWTSDLEKMKLIIEKK